ncbi:MAG TPA: ATP synthase F1 subunit delta [Gemmataceae bacterium]|jgi:F-type H+-transporting ATPase subunit delta|nr:ATP synthase F1 subunit delta [Gemmataceae bacterium]
MHKGQPSDLDPTQATSVFDIDALRVARVYAEALLNAAEKAGKAEEIWEQLFALVGKPLRRSDSPADPVALLTSTAIPRGRRDEIIRVALEGKVDTLLLNTIFVLNDHQRLGILRPVAAVYHELMEVRARRVRVQVKSAVPLTDAEREQVKEMARQRLNLDPVLAESVDPSLLGGLRVQVGDRVIDATVRARLDSLKNQLLSRSSYAIRR